MPDWLIDTDPPPFGPRVSWPFAPPPLLPPCLRSAGPQPRPAASPRRARPRGPGRGGGATVGGSPGPPARGGAQMGGATDGAQVGEERRRRGLAPRPPRPAAAAEVNAAATAAAV